MTNKKLIYGRGVKKKISKGSVMTCKTGNISRGRKIKKKK
jgi:hypothetical protein